MGCGVPLPGREAGNQQRELLIARRSGERVTGLTESRPLRCSELLCPDADYGSTIEEFVNRFHAVGIKETEMLVT
jgi:hypothetical protein